MIALFCDNSAIRIMPLRFHMDVVPPRVVGNMNDAMIESNEQVPCRGSTMSEYHAPCRRFFPAVDRGVAKKFISPDGDGSIHVQRHFVGLSQMKSWVAEIGKRLAAARGGRWWDLALIPPIADKDLVTATAGHGRDVAHRDLPRRRICIGLYVQAVGRSELSECRLPRT